MVVSQAEARAHNWRTVVLQLLSLLLVLVAAVAVIYVSHMNRRTFAEYQMLLNTRDDLETEWGQLLLEESALASYSRIESIATKGLGMRAPKAADIIMVQR